MIEIAGALMPRDYVRAQFLHMRPRPVIRVLGVFLLVLYTWAVWRSFSRQDAGGTIGSQVALLCIGAYLALFFFAYLPWKARRIFWQQKSLQREFTMQFTEAGVEGSTETGQATTPWGDYLKWKENREMLLLYLSDAIFQMVPKRLFLTQGDVDRFRQMVKENIGEEGV